MKKKSRVLTIKEPNVKTVQTMEIEINSVQAKKEVKELVTLFAQLEKAINKTTLACQKLSKVEIGVNVKSG